jgi:type II secretory pathway component PulF
MKHFKKVMLEKLPSNVKMSDKEILILIRDLFEMVKSNNQLIQLLSIRVSGLENKNKKGTTNEISSI